ncbi:MAG: hypothetical protein CMH79_04260 [Nitrospinae bacterium]|nr:hypothetical protein [Nitrospinota bacterium]
MNEEYYTKYIKYYQSKVNNDDTLITKNINKDIDNLTYIEDEDEMFNHYPDYNDNDFIYKISNKMEYSHLKSLLNITEIDNRCLRKNGEYQFELSNNQQFLKNFMNKKTPYRGLVIFHGVGVGKTCSAVNISSSFRDIYLSNKERIICLVPKNIRGGWENTIYDKSMGINQCSTDSFEDILNNQEERVTDKKVKNMINNYYEFYGYLKFANSVKKLVKKTINNMKLEEKEYKKIEKEIIRKNYSNRIIIIDEIHNLREENDENNKGDKNIKIKKGDRILWEDNRGVSRYGEVISLEIKDKDKIYNIRKEEDDSIIPVHSEYIRKAYEDEKKAREMIEKVIEYSEGLRLILLSATPMFNKSTEVIWLLNLLLKNDGRPTLSYNDIFEKDDRLTEKGRQLIQKKSSGYFTYLRGENPISFPIRLYPDVNDDIRCIGGNHNSKKNYIDYPNLSLFRHSKKGHISIKNRYQFKFMKMYSSIMVNQQKDIYELFIKKLQDKRKDDGTALMLSDRNIGLQISNITYTNNNVKNIRKVYGQKGYNTIFNDKIERKRKVCSYINESEPLLDINNLENISCKMFTIINNMLKNKTEGIIFIYSDFIYSGVLPMALALEHIGFEKYKGGNHLNYPEWKKGSQDNSTKGEPLDYQFERFSKSTHKKRAKYIILTGDKSLSPNNELERKASAHENNIYGENIKVILGNTVTSEGMDFRNIREIHVLDPWYHLYKIEQIIGRGIRYCSHNLQPKQKQNVTVYLHTSSIDAEIESIDTNTYRIAEEKASDIGKIEKILKENSIDCFLNKQINHINTLEKINMKTSSHKNIEIDINDKDFTKICSFSGKTVKKGKPLGDSHCEINCNISKEKWDKLLNTIQDDSLIDTDTFTIHDIYDSIKLIYKIIKELYNNYNCYTLDELIEEIKYIIDTNKKIIFHSLEEIIDNKWVIWNNGINGYIIQINDYYIFQPFYNTDIFIPYIYRAKKIQDIHNHEIKYNTGLSIDIINDVNCSMNYNDIYEKIKDNINTIEKDISLLRPYLSKLNPETMIDHYIDRLTYEEKKVLLKEVLCEYIENNYNNLYDEIDQMILKFFEYNLIRIDENEEYHILNDEGNIIGFFLYNTEEYYKNTEKDVLDDFTYYIYKESQWIILDNIGLYSIKNNFTKDKQIFKTTPIWGYSFKDETQNHMFKIIDSTTFDNKSPGKVIGNKGVKPITLLKDFSQDLKDDFKLYIKNIIKIIESGKSTNDIDSFRKKLKGIDINTLIKLLLTEFKKKKTKSNKNIISKEFITLLFEMSLRNTYSYLNYDMFLLKYIS